MNRQISSAVCFASSGRPLGVFVLIADRSGILKLRVIGFTAALALSCGIARADKLIWIPTAGISHLGQVEYMTEADGNRGVLTGQVGVAKQFELLVRHYRNFSTSDKTEVGGQFTILPEGFATPGIAIGVWDVAEDGPRGRRVLVSSPRRFPSSTSCRSVSMTSRSTRGSAPTSSRASSWAARPASRLASAPTQSTTHGTSMPAFPGARSG